MYRDYDFIKNIIQDKTPIIDALKRLEAVNYKILFVVDDDNRIVASVTDGDIRRAILAGNALDNSVICIARKNFRKVSMGEDEKAAQIMIESQILAVPAVDSNDHIKYICLLDAPNAIEIQEKVNIPVVIMAGGKGARLYPYTKILPKPLIPVEGTPICERIIKRFLNNGCNMFHMVVNYKKNMIKSYFFDTDVSAYITYYDEAMPLGTGGGLKMLESTIDGTFILTNCDILILEEIASMVRHHKEMGNKATMICSLKNYSIPYGVVHFSNGGKLEQMEEKPEMSFFVNTGYYILEKEVFSYISENENVGMPEIVERMKADGLNVGVYPISDNAWLDMGQFDTMESMEKRIRELGL